MPLGLNATFFANPAQPILQKEGILIDPPSWYGLRIGYLADYLVRQEYRDGVSSLEGHSSRARLTTDAALITFSFKDRLDLDTLIGSSQLQIDQDVFTKRQFAWGVGAKLLLWKIGSFCSALDFKYFESLQKPLFFVSEGSAFNVLSNFRLSYYELQGAFGIAYQADCLCPYIYVTYLYSRIDPTPLTVVLKHPLVELKFSTTSHFLVSESCFGMALGATLIGGDRSSLTLEGRFFNQTAVTISGEIRF